MSVVNYNKINKLVSEKFSSKVKAAAKIGMKKSSFYNICDGTKDPSIDELLEISKLLECNINELFHTSPNISLDILQEDRPKYDSYQELRDYVNRIKGEVDRLGNMFNVHISDCHGHNSTKRGQRSA